MYKNAVETNYTKALSVCNIMVRITGRTLHHGETDYDYSRVFDCMNERLVWSFVLAAEIV